MRQCNYSGCTFKARIFTSYCFRHTGGRPSCVAAFCRNTPGIGGIWCEDHRARQAQHPRSLFKMPESNGKKMRADADYAEHWRSRFADLDAEDFTYPMIEDEEERETG